MPQVGPAGALRTGDIVRKKSAQCSAPSASVRWRLQVRADAVGEGGVPVMSQICAHRPRDCLMMRLVVLSLAVSAVGTAPSTASAQDWALNPSASHFYMQTAKANAVIETHGFTGLDGGVTKDGDAIVKIDLLSVKSGIDVRDVRMRFLLFETFKFPYAEVTAKLDMGKLQELTRNIRVSYPLKFKLNLHGVIREMESPVWVTRLTDKSVSVATEQPVIVTAESHDLAAGVVKLSEAVNGTP